MKKHISIFLLTLTAVLLLSFGTNAMVVIDNCDKFVLNNISLWGGTHAEAITSDEAPEGSGYIKAIPANGLMILTKAFDNTDVSAYPYLYLDIYLSDASSVTSGQLEITSSGRPDSEESSWEVPSLKLTDGWNHLKLKISDANAEGGSFNVKNFNTFRIFVYTSNENNVLCADRLGFGTAEECKLVIDNCDKLGEESSVTGNTWIGGGLYTVTEHGKDEVPEGEGCIYQTDSATIILQCTSTETFDISEYEEDGYLMFWFYTSDHLGTQFTGQIELTSSGASDVEELTWSMSDIKRKINNGWNKIALPISSAQKMSDTDLSAINFFRIYDFVISEDDAIEFRVDNVCVGTKDEAIAAGFITEEEITTPDTTEKPSDNTSEAPKESVSESRKESEVNTATETTPSADSDKDSGNTGLVVAICIAGVIIIAAAVIVFIKIKKAKSSK